MLKKYWVPKGYISNARIKENDIPVYIFHAEEKNKCVSCGFEETKDFKVNSFQLDLCLACETSLNFRFLLTRDFKI